MEDRLPTGLLVSAQIRAAAREGIPMTIVHKGDPDRGTIILKINLLNGFFHLLREVRTGDALTWAFACAEGDLPEDKADSYLEKELAFDPDLWIIEIEKLGGLLPSKEIWLSSATDTHRV